MAFTNDRESKELVKQTLTHYLSSAYNITYKVFTKDSGVTENEEEENLHYPIDLFIALEDKRKPNTTYTLLMEIKDRRYKYHYKSTDLGTDRNDEGWVLEIHKYNTLKEHKEVSGCSRMLYVNLYEDNKIHIWNLDKAKMKRGHKPMSKCTMEDRGKKNKEVYWLYNDDALELDVIS